MNILVLDVYPDVDYRISKDQNGGYGTANNYGNTIFTKFLKLVVSKSIDFPPLFSVQVIGELKNSNHNVQFEKKLPKNLNNFDFVIIASSIVCHETEIKTIKSIKLNNKIVFAIGPFATSNPDNYLKAGAKVIIGEPEMFFHKFNLTIDEMNELPNKISNFKNKLANRL